MLLASGSASVSPFNVPYPIAIYGTAITIFLWWILSSFAQHAIGRDEVPKERYRHRQVFRTIVAICAVTIIVLLWARLLQHTGTFLGIIGAGLAIALREPLLSIAGRIAISAGNIYSAGDRIEIDKFAGDVIDVGFFYTRMMEIGNWIKGDQVSGRIVQFPNAKIFGTQVFNYTRDFAYIWDEVFIPITYDSNMQEMTNILLTVGETYTREFLQGAEEQLQEMKLYFLVPSLELKPNVYVRVTDNWLELRMRYVVDPKKRRTASTFIYSEAFKRIRGRKDISIASSTMDLTVQGETPRSSETNPVEPGEDAA